MKTFGCVSECDDDEFLSSERRRKRDDWRLSHCRHLSPSWSSRLVWDQCLRCRTGLDQRRNLVVLSDTRLEINNVREPSPSLVVGLIKLLFTKLIYWLYIYNPSIIIIEGTFYWIHYIFLFSIISGLSQFLILLLSKTWIDWRCSPPPAASSSSLLHHRVLRGNLLLFISNFLFFSLHP